MRQLHRPDPPPPSDARANATEAARCGGVPEAAIAALSSAEPSRNNGLPPYVHQHFNAASLLKTLASEGLLSEAQRADSLQALLACQRRGPHMHGAERALKEAVAESSEAAATTP